MNSRSRRILMTTMFAAVASLTAAMVVTSALGISMIIPALGQGGNMTDGGNYTEGNMTGTDMAGSGVATPPVMMP